MMWKDASRISAIGIILLVSFLMVGCYTQLDRPGVRVDDDDYYAEELENEEYFETVEDDSADYVQYEYYPNYVVDVPYHRVPFDSYNNPYWGGYYNPSYGYGTFVNFGHYDPFCNYYLGSPYARFNSYWAYDPWGYDPYSYRYRYYSPYRWDWNYYGYGSYGGYYGDSVIKQKRHFGQRHVGAAVASVTTRKQGSSRRTSAPPTSIAKRRQGGSRSTAKQLTQKRTVTRRSPAKRIKRSSRINTNDGSKSRRISKSAKNISKRRSQPKRSSASKARTQRQSSQKTTRRSSNQPGKRSSVSRSTPQQSSSTGNSRSSSPRSSSTSKRSGSSSSKGSSSSGSSSKGSSKSSSKGSSKRR